MICRNCHNEIGEAAYCPYCGAAVLLEPLPHHLPAGALVGGRFRIEGVLGEGGFGITYLARDDKLNLLVAVKEYYPRGFSYRSHTGTNEVYVSTQNDAEFYAHGKQRFLSEARTLARFSDEPGVVSVTDYIEENNTVYLVMEYLRGQNLQQYLKQRGRISADEAFAMLEPVMKTLEKIHAAGVIHRDISPDNIMVLQNGAVKLMDFGAAKEFVDESRSMSVMLKNGYAPMEQYRRNGRQGPWTDVYALCATVYRCITGKTPEDSLDRVVEDEMPRPSQLGAAITPAMESVLMHGMAVHQKDRCQNMTELLYRIDQARRMAWQPVPPPAPVNPIVNPPVNTSEPRPLRNTGMNPPIPQIDPNATIYADGIQPVRPAQQVQPQPVQPAQSVRSVQKPSEPKKKGKAGLVIGIIAAVLVVAVVMGIIFIKPQVSSSSSSQKAGETQAAAALSDNTAVEAGRNHTVALQKDGTVVATGNNEYGQCDVGDWTDITAVSAGGSHTVGLQEDGTVVATGDNEFGQCNVGDWTDIIAVAAGSRHTVGLKKDGTVAATGTNGNGQCDVGKWSGIKAVSAGSYHTVGLQEDGTVVATKSTNNDFEFGQSAVSGWTDIVSIAAGGYHTVGLQKDGSVVATKVTVDIYDKNQSDIGGWQGITAISVGDLYTVGLTEDGTVVATGLNDCGQCDVEDWKNITAVSAGLKHTVGLTEGGSVVAAGSNDDGQSSVGDWN